MPDAFPSDRILKRHPAVVGAVMSSLGPVAGPCETPERTSTAHQKAFTRGHVAHDLGKDQATFYTPSSVSSYLYFDLFRSCSVTIVCSLDLCHPLVHQFPNLFVQLELSLVCH